MGYNDSGLLEFALFSEFARISGPHISVAKMVFVPLFPFDLLELSALISRLVPEWAGVEINDVAKYLGFMVGLGKQQQSWRAPLLKYSQRSVEWGRARLGLHMTLRAYRVYVISVLMFVAQLEDPPEDF